MSERDGVFRALESFGGALVERFGSLNVWTGLLLAGAVVADRALAHRVRASWRIALYAPIALRVVAPLDWSLPVAPMPRVLAYFTPALEIFGAAAKTEPTSATLASWRAVVGVAYVVVAALLATRGVRARLKLNRALATAAPLPRRGDISYALVRHAVLGPMAVGVLSPRIVLPARLLLPGEEGALDCVLRHEAAHLRRGDPWLSVVMQILVVGAWPVFPLWIAVTRTRHLVELACDEAALAGADATRRRRYGHALLDIAEWRALAVAPIDVGELHFGSTLRARIEALASERHWPLGAQLLALSCASMVLLGASSGSLRAAAPSLPAEASSAAEDETAYGYAFEVDAAKNLAIDPAALSLPLRPGDRVPPETVQALVRAHYPAFSRCYQSGLARDPALSGTVTIKAIADRSGVTRQALDEGSTLRDAAVVRCILRDFAEITYPHGGGDLTLLYSVEFAP